jgi:starch-binding outer membrane protein SusE/F
MNFMKAILHKLFIALAAILLFTGCKRDAVLTYMDVVTFPSAVTVSSNNVVLSAANNDSSVITISWPAVIFKVDAPVTYTLQLDVPADTVGGSAWSNAVSVEAGKDVTSKSYKGSDLNTIALSKLGLMPDSVNTIVVRVKATLDRDVYSRAAAFKVTPYQVFVANVLYVPGAYQGWDPGSAPAIAEANGRPKMYEGYIYMPGTGEQDFKYTNARDWAHTNYGDGGNGTFSTDGAAAGLHVPDGGYYECTADLNTNTWTATKTTWSIIGDATPGGWTTDTQMTYDPTAQVWKVTADMLSGGSFKFRANNAWVIDFAIDATGKLVYADNPFLGYTAGLNNLTVPSNGNYTITLDLHSSGNYSYTLHKN